MKESSPDQGQKFDIESSDAGNGLETKRDCGTIYHTIQSILTLKRTWKKH